MQTNLKEYPVFEMRERELKSYIRTYPVAGPAPTFAI